MLVNAGFYREQCRRGERDLVSKENVEKVKTLRTCGG